MLFYHDRDGEWSRLGQRVLRALQLNEPEDLIAWVQTANKMDVAALAVEVFAAAVERDRIARDILKGAAHSLAKDAVHCARKLVPADEPVQFVLAGSVLLKQCGFQKQVIQLIKELWLRAICTPLKRSGVWGAVEMAKELLVDSPGNQHEEDRFELGTRNSELKIERSSASLPWAVEQIAASPTEQRNPRSRELDRLATPDAIKLMLSEDVKVPAAVRQESANIAWVIERISRAFKRGGRLFYAGAGTSGRLGVLDASECPPTFRTDPERVQAIMAGGQNAIWSSVEGAEDDPDAGARAVQFRGVRRGDIVVGIAASGRTPFVWGALWEAKRRGATTVLVCFNPRLKLRKADRPQRIIAPNLGPEILTGSTRLKAGTATKLILNMFTTLAMVRTGKVLSNLMIDVNASNTKLRDRATRITCELTGAAYATAQAALERCSWQIKLACACLKAKEVSKT